MHWLFLDSQKTIAAGSGTSIIYASVSIMTTSYHPRLTLVSFGGGQDSTDIIYSICEDLVFRRMFAPQDIVVIMSDT